MFGIVSLAEASNIAALQRWYEMQLKAKQMHMLEETNQTTQKVLERNETNVTVMSGDDQNSTESNSTVYTKPLDHNVSQTIKTVDINVTQKVSEQNLSQPVENVDLNHSVEKKEIKEDTNQTLMAEQNLTNVAKMMESNRTKPIVIVKYIHNDKSKALCQSLSRSTIDFWRLLDLTLINATAMIMKEHDIKITKENLEIIRSAYYPNLSIGYGGEYYHGYARRAETGVGGKFYPSTSAFRDALTVDFTHELYHFGATDEKVKIGEKDVELVKSELELKAEEISQRLLSNFISVLKAEYIIDNKERARAVQERILAKKERLYEAGQVARIALSKDKLTLINIEKEIAQQKIMRLHAIKQIEQLANIAIDINRSKFAMIEPKNIKVKRFEESAQAKYLQLKIAKKYHELELARKEYLPGVYASGDYVLLGSDKALFEAIKRLRKNSWSVGLNVKWNLFNGHKTERTIDKIKYEIKKLSAQYRLAKIDFEAKKEQRDMLKASIDRLLKVESEVYAQTCEQAEIMSRLQQVGLADALQLDYIEMNKLQSQLDFKLGVLEKVYQTVAGELIR